MVFFPIPNSSRLFLVRQMDYANILTISINSSRLVVLNPDLSRMFGKLVRQQSRLLITSASLWLVQACRLWLHCRMPQYYKPTTKYQNPKVLILSFSSQDGGLQIFCAPLTYTPSYPPSVHQGGWHHKVLSRRQHD